MVLNGGMVMVQGTQDNAGTDVTASGGQAHLFVSPPGIPGIEMICEIRGMHAMVSTRASP